ncbi:putative MFS family arabinose efflux permease [Sphingomonas vulcanisoli]|uniref:MFS family arabinose efflux permease n=1 Tax=Sphingomonas vulcanisoli TaxID=1658060 RepID=A0ABX0TW53_9SPHN|nr:MFS transporter [Sphingomonas vulcanisoli]NIJ08404.1 putative MFS family arabinose efflux permease [Sphingomonas vulcanisoli]
MLLIVYIFNFVDRQILGILAGPIKAELRLSDTQMGMLGGLAFALLYSTLGIPLAALADHTRRTWVITGSLAVWSLFTAICGLAGSFGLFFVARLGVGVGEAGGVAPSYALIGEVFPARSRARALAVYSLGIPLGSALGVLFGGYIAATVSWRTAFLCVGGAGLLFAPLFALFVREPARAARQEKAALRDTFAILARKPSFWLLSFGAGSSSMLGYGLAFWLPSLLKRSFGMELLAVSHFFGLLLLIGGTIGVLAGGWLGDRLGGRDRGAYATVPAIAFVVAVPLFAAGLLSHSAWAAFLLFLLPQALAYVWLGPVLTAAQHLVPASLRATASASFLLINNLIGVGFGALTIGALSDALTPHFGAEALRTAILIALGFYLIAAALMALAARHLRRDWID